MNKRLFYIFLLIIGISKVDAQQVQKGWEIGGLGGISYYFGDLNTEWDLTHPGYAFGLGARYNFNNRVSLKVSANYATISGDDKYSSNDFQLARNLNFKSNIFEGTFQFEFNFLPYTHGSKDDYYTPYVLSGITVFHFDPKTEYQDKLVSLQPLGTEGQFSGDEYYLIKAGIPYGVGFKYDFNYEWSMNIEFVGHWIFTDYLDDVSQNYPDKEDLSNLHGQIAVDLSDPSLPGGDKYGLGDTGRQRGNGKNNDTWATARIGVFYYFGSVPCPSFSGSKRPIRRYF